MSAVQTNAAQKLQFSVSGIGPTNATSGLYLRLFDVNGNVLTSGQGAVEYTFSIASNYYVGVSAPTNVQYAALTGDGDQPAPSVAALAPPFGAHLGQHLPLLFDSESQIGPARKIANFAVMSLMS